MSDPTKERCSAFSAEIAPLGYAAFDAWSLRTGGAFHLPRHGNFAVSSYGFRLIGTYLRSGWHVDCPAMARAATDILPFDYPSLLREVRDHNASARWQLRLLTQFGVGHAWIVPASSVRHCRGVTCYMTGYGPSREAQHLAARDQIHLASTRFLADLITLDPQPALEDVETCSARVPLTERELDCVLAVSEGLTNSLAAKALGISENTVRFHLKNAFRKLGVRSRAEAVRKVTMLQVNNT